MVTLVILLLVIGIVVAEWTRQYRDRWLLVTALLLVDVTRAIVDPASDIPLRLVNALGIVSNLIVCAIWLPRSGYVCRLRGHHWVTVATTERGSWRFSANRDELTEAMLRQFVPEGGATITSTCMACGIDTPPPSMTRGTS